MMCQVVCKIKMADNHLSLKKMTRSAAQSDSCQVIMIFGRLDFISPLFPKEIFLILVVFFPIDDGR